LFIIATDTKENIIYVGQGQEHPGLLRKGLFVPEPDIHWIRPDLEMRIGNEQEFMVRIRYRQPLQKARLYRKENGMYFVFEEFQRGITPGQFAAWHKDGELLGSGIIS
jgi:tRNA-specific 2-thiouridylase